MLRRSSQKVDDNLKQNTQLCILFDPSVIDGPEDYMPDESLVFFHPSSVPMSRQRSITGHLHAISNMISDIRPTAKPFLFTFLHCRVCVVAVDKFLLALSGPLTMPRHTLISQIKLLVDAIFFFSGPLSHYQPRPDDPHPEDSFNVHINSVLEFMVRHLMSERLSVMRSSLGYTQSKFNIPTEYLLRTASTIESLPGVSGGIVLHKGKLVFSSLPNNLTSLLLTVDSLAVPAEVINTDKGNNMEVFIVYIPLETWAKISYPSDDIEVSSAADLLNGVEFGDDECVVMDSSQEGAGEDEEATFEFVEDDIPHLPETILMPSHSTSRSIFRSLSQTQGKFSLKSELFEGNKPISPLTHYGNNRHARRASSITSLSSIKSSPSIKALVDNVFYDSLNSPEFNQYDHPSQGNQYHHPSQGAPFIQSRPQDNDFLDVSLCPSGNSLNYKLQSEQHLEAQSISQSSEQTQESLFLDAINDDEPLGVLKKWSWIEHIDQLQYTEAELAVQHTADTTLLLIGTNLASSTTELWNTSIVLLGDISAAINTESLKVMKKFTAGINSFVYNKGTGLFSHNVSFNSTKESQNDVSFCKSMLEDDSEVTMVCAGNSGGSVTGYRTTSNEVYQTSKGFSLGRLCDGMEETIARNFDTLHL